MITLSNYKIIPENNCFYILSEEPRICPICSSVLQVCGSRNRVVVTSSRSVTFRLRRLKCPQCRKIHTEIPDCILPYKHYSRELIEKAISGDIHYCPAEDSTIYRWKHTEKV